MSKGKGSQFERDICKTLSEWWSPGRSDIFWRSSNSGGRATVRHRQGKGTFGQYGDIQATDPAGQPLIDLCTIELKRGYSTSLLDVFDLGDTKTRKHPPLFEQFLHQAAEECEAAKAFYWMLITKRDKRASSIYMPLTFYKVLSLSGASLRDANPMLRICPRSDGTVYIEPLFATRLDEFLRLTTRDNVVKALKTERRR